LKFQTAQYFEESEMTPQPSSEKTLQEVDEKVKKYMPAYFHCAQTSFLTLKEQFGLKDWGILKALTPFVGIGLRGETCGAVVGSLMALGLVFGRDKLDDQEAFQASIPSAVEFCTRFEKEVGSTMCSSIIEKDFGRKYNLMDPAQVEEWLAAGAVEKCTDVVRKAVGIASEILMNKE
jgi:C_GCAxxG_C_C family probable redox protein